MSYHIRCPAPHRTALPRPALPRRLLELNPGPKIMEQARTVLAACEKAPSDAIKINYDPRNPFDLCSVTFTPIYKVGHCPAGPMQHLPASPASRHGMHPLVHPGQHAQEAASHPS